MRRNLKRRTDAALKERNLSGGIFNFERIYIMKTSYAVTIALALATLGATYANAADLSATGKTREQVRAELSAAQRSGDIAYGETGAKLNELFPGQYPVQPASQGLTRDQVKAELFAAQRNGDTIAYGEIGAKRNELFPGQYPAKLVNQGVTRDQIKMELFDALRSGDALANGETGVKLNELFPSRYSKKS